MTTLTYQTSLATLEIAHLRDSPCSFWFESELIRSQVRKICFGDANKLIILKFWNSKTSSKRGFQIPFPNWNRFPRLSYSSQFFVNRCLNYSLDKTKISPQDTLSVISGVASNPESWKMAWDFFREHWHILNERYEEYQLIISHLEAIWSLLQNVVPLSPWRLSCNLKSHNSS